MLDEEDITLSSQLGGLGTQATVFQAECHAILHSIEQINRQGDIHILTDNQAVAKNPANPNTTTHNVKTLKTALSTLAETRTVTDRWVKAHVGHYGNKLADELAKQGSTLDLHYMDPNCMSDYPNHKLTTIIHTHSITQWHQRWQKRADSRQWAIFFPTPNPKKSNEIIHLHRAPPSFPLFRASTLCVAQTAKAN